MKNVLKTIAIIELIGGIIASFFFARIGGINLLITGASKRDWPLTIIIFLAVLFGCFVNFVILYSIYEILDNQERIFVKNSEKLNQITMKIDKEEAADESSSDKWMCPDCGKYNSYYVGTCGCGYSKIKI